MASDRSLEQPRVIEHRTSRAGRWLRARRTRIALWIAVIEGVIVAFTHDVSRYTVIIIAVPLLALYVVWGRNARSDTLRQLAWIAGASQAMAVVVTVLSFIIAWLALVIAGIFAAIALVFLLVDRG
ncbi:MAG TPA: hypothetical protein VE753_06720 [Gaiellaceae bacterium]|jgi:hypothetical protein|nr:hypothetical protein [Gaiellaceae bacterium]